MPDSFCAFYPKGEPDRTLSVDVSATGGLAPQRPSVACLALKSAFAPSTGRNSCGLRRRRGWVLWLAGLALQSGRVVPGRSQAEVHCLTGGLP